MPRQKKITAKSQKALRISKSPQQAIIQNADRRANVIANKLMTQSDFLAWGVDKQNFPVRTARGFSPLRKFLFATDMKT